VAIKRSIYLGSLIKEIYENYEMLSRWTPEFTAKELLIIIAMRENRNYTVSEIAKATGFPMSTTSFLLEKLTKKKSLSRRRAQNDRRVVSLKLTKKGRNALDEYNAIFEKISRHMLETLSEDETSDFLGSLKKIVGSLK